MEKPTVKCEYCGIEVYSRNDLYPLTDERIPYIDGKRACYDCYDKKTKEWKKNWGK